MARPSLEEQAMKIFSLCCLAFLTAASCSNSATSVTADPQVKPRVTQTTGCLSEDEVAMKLAAITKSDYQKANQIKESLLNESQKSSVCRQALIESVVRTMDRPLSSNADKAEQADRFNIWRAGADVLGYLKATEAVDFLVDHLGFTTGPFSMMMSQQPALHAVTAIGESAIPKLSDTLRHHPNWKMRLDAVYCISFIGGPSAVRALKEALPSESDVCVKPFIEVSIKTLDNDQQKWKHDNNNEWFGAYMFCNHSTQNE
jgi:hypothetical protein